MATRARRLITIVLCGVVVLILASCDSADGGPSRPPARGVVWGKVTAGPTCPVERVDQPCPPHPVKGTVRAIGSSGRQAGSVRTTADGSYSLRLSAGRYRLEVVTGSMFPHCPTVTVRVVAGTRKRADIDCDTGIR